MGLLDHELPNYLKNQPEVVLDAIFARNDMRKALRIEANGEQIEDQAVWDLINDLPAFMEALPATRNKLALASYKLHDPETWEADFTDLLNQSQMKLAGDIVQLFNDAGKADEIKET